MNISKLLAIIHMAIAALFIHGLAFCLDIPKTPLDVEGTDAEYRELLGLWKGYWDEKYDHVILFYKISGGKAYIMQSWSNADRSVKRIWEIHQNDNLFVVNYTTLFGNYQLTCKKGSTKIYGRHFPKRTGGSGRAGVFKKVE